MLLTEKKRHSVVKTARKLFLQQGFHATSMDQIAEHAGITKKTIYHHFATKTELFQTVIAEHWQTMIQFDEPLFNTAKSVTENLYSFAQRFLKFLSMKKTRNIFRLLIAESQRFPQLAKGILSGKHTSFGQELICYLDQQIASGNLQISDTRMAAYQLMGLIKEQHFWLQLFGSAATPAPQQNISIKKSIEMFISYYSLHP